MEIIILTYAEATSVVVVLSKFKIQCFLFFSLKIIQIVH